LTLWKQRKERKGAEDAKGLNRKNQRIESSAIFAPLRPLRSFQSRTSVWQQFSWVCGFIAKPTAKVMDFADAGEWCLW
jgi:hypothetical protein